ncbi:MAG: PEP/pyruvate-binding domain-containing protein [Solirubrobacteraceae bacterium]
MTYSRLLHELRLADEPQFGGKSANLGELLAAEIPVPPGFALPTAAFDAFLEETGLRGEITAALEHVAPGDVDSVGGASHKISEAMRSAPLPGAVCDEIGAAYERLAREQDVTEPPVAVRSSAVGEDSQDATYAGQQETYLWVRGIDRVCDAVRDCWVSLYSTPAISYRLRLDDGAVPAAMGVTVQLMVDAAVSGVMFTCNPVSGDPSMIAINASWGLGLAVVGGEVTPDDYLVSKVTREVVREHIHSKHVEYTPDRTSRGAVRHAVPDGRRDAPCLDAAAIAELVDIARRVEAFFGSHQDIEWARDHEARLSIVQSRPVTAVPKRTEKPVPRDALSLVMSTFGATRRDVTD